MVILFIPYKSCNDVGRMKERIRIIKEHKKMKITNFEHGVYIEEEGENNEKC